MFANLSTTYIERDYSFSRRLSVFNQIMAQRSLVLSSIWEKILFPTTFIYLILESALDPWPVISYI